MEGTVHSIGRRRVHKRPIGKTPWPTVQLQPGETQQGLRYTNAVDKEEVDEEEVAREDVAQEEEHKHGHHKETADENTHPPPLTSIFPNTRRKEPRFHKFKELTTAQLVEKLSSTLKMIQDVQKAMVHRELQCTDLVIDHSSTIWVAVIGIADSLTQSVSMLTKIAEALPLKADTLFDDILEQLNEQMDIVQRRRHAAINKKLIDNQKATDGETAKAGGFGGKSSEPSVRQPQLIEKDCRMSENNPAKHPRQRSNSPEPRAKHPRLEMKDGKLSETSYCKAPQNKHSKLPEINTAERPRQLSNPPQHRDNHSKNDDSIMPRPLKGQFEGNTSSYATETVPQNSGAASTISIQIHQLNPLVGSELSLLSTYGDKFGPSGWNRKEDEGKTREQIRRACTKDVGLLEGIRQKVHAAKCDSQDSKITEAWLLLQEQDRYLSNISDRIFERLKAHWILPAHTVRLAP